MGAAAYIKKHFLNAELCITLGDDAETLTYDQSWSANKEYFRGTIVEVDEGIVVLEIEGQGKLYIEESHIKCFWKPSFNYYLAISASITTKPAGRRGK